MAEALDPALTPLSELARHRVYIFSAPDAEGSPQRLGLLPRGAVAGLIVGQRPQRYAILFVLADGWQLEELDFALNTIRASLDARLVDQRVRGSFREAAEIQQSLLVEEPPEFAGYELAARSVPADEVGGDFYDFYDLGEGTLGLAIGDASGHGLPAALLVRDVVTGLRMGIEKELKVAHVFEKLNRVIHRSRLSSRFVSVFYCELERDGNLVYVNAGHQPPILFFREQTPGKVSEVELSNGGTVIGPLPEARFQPRLRAAAPGRGAAAAHRRHPRAARQEGRVLRRRARAGPRAPAPVAAGERHPRAPVRRGARLGRRAALGGRRHDRGGEARRAAASVGGTLRRPSHPATLAGVNPARFAARGPFRASR